MRRLAVLLVAGAVAVSMSVAQGAPREAPIPVLQMAPTTVEAIAFSPDGKWVASAGDEVELWEAKTRVRVRTFGGEQHAVTSVAFSPDGRTVAAGGGGGAGDVTGVSQWEVHTGKLLHTWGAPGRAVLSVSFARDGTLYAVGPTPDGKAVRAWRTEELPAWVEAEPAAPEQSEANAARLGGGPPRNGLGAMRPRVAVLSPRADALAVAYDVQRPRARSVSSKVVLCDPRTGAVKRTLAQPDMIFALAFSRDGARLATGGFTPTLRESVSVWQISTGRLLRAMKPAGDMVTAVAFSPDGDLVAGGDFVIKLWDVKTGAVARKLVARLEEQAETLAFSPDGASLATGVKGGHSADRPLLLWTTRTGAMVGGFGRVPNGETWVEAVAISPEGNWLAASGRDESLRFWDLRTGTLARTIPTNTPADALVFSPDGRTVAAVAAGGTSLWEVETGRPVSGPKVMAATAAFSPEGTRLLTSAEGMAPTQLWEVGTGKLVRDFGLGFGAAFSPDGKLIAVGGVNKTEAELAAADSEADPPQGMVRVWQASGQPVQTWKTGPFLWPSRLAFSHEGRFLICGIHPPLELAHSETRVWEVQSGEAVRRLPGELFDALLPGGLMITIAYDESGRGPEARVREVASGALRTRVPGVDLQCAFTPAGDRYAVSAGGGVEVREVKTGRVVVALLALPPRAEQISADWLAVTPEGEFAGAPGADESVRWRVGERLLSTAEYDQQFHRRRADLADALTPTK